MKIYAVRDERDLNKKILAHLIYFEKEKKFYAELPKDADEWVTPLIFSSFAKRKIYTVDSEWSLRWVQQRIIPPDRQNIAMVLRDNGIPEYDEYALLMPAMGRCAQDDYYLEEEKFEELPEEIRLRFKRKIREISLQDDFKIRVVFKDETKKLCSLRKYFEKNIRFSILLEKPEYFAFAKIQPGGYGVSWDVALNIMDSWFYEWEEDEDV